MNHRHPVIAFLLLATTLFTAACSTTTEGAPTPRPETRSSAVAPTSPSGPDVPSVENPIDLSAYLSRPCETLTPEQSTELEVEAPGQPTTTGGIADEVGPYCTWSDSTGSRSVTVAFLTVNTGGLATVYESQDQFAYFVPTTVGDHPAVLADYKDFRQQGECNVIVGTSDRTTFRASARGNLDAQQSCDRAELIAKEALSTMGGGS